MAIESAGVFAIDERGWHLWHSAREPIRAVQDVGGELYVLSSSGVSRVRGLGAVSSVAPIDADSYRALGEPQALAIDGEQLWVIGRTGLGRWTGSWSITALDEATPTDTHALAHAGSSSWAIWAGALRRFDGSSWSPIELAPELTPQDLATLGDDLLVHGGCRVDASNTSKHCRLLRMHADAPSVRELDTTGCPDDAQLAVSEHGRFAALVGACGLLRVDLSSADATAQRFAIEHDGVRESALDLAIDDSGRAWIGTGRGLLLVETDGSVLSLPLARLTEIAAPVLGVHVTGSGPQPPALGDERRGGIAGRVVRSDRSPIAGATIELCHGAPAFASTPHDPISGDIQPDPTSPPCAGVEPIVRTTSDEQGRFEIDNLVLGRHVVAVEVEGRWALGQASTMTMRAGMIGNIGNVVVDGL